MTQYLTYDFDTGKIDNMLTCSYSDLLLNIKDGQGYLESDKSGLDYYVINGELSPRLEINDTVPIPGLIDDKVTLIAGTDMFSWGPGIPEGSRIMITSTSPEGEIDSNFVAIADGMIEVECEVKTNVRLILDIWPYKDRELILEFI